MSIPLIQNIDPNALSGTVNALIEQVNAMTIGSVMPSGAANLVVATPNGFSGTASLRALVTTDLPIGGYNVVTPFMFGAYGDNTHSDSAAINAAAAYAANNNLILDLRGAPSGSWRCTTTVTLYVPNANCINLVAPQTIIADENSILSFVSVANGGSYPTGFAVQIGDPLQGFQNGRVQGLTIQGFLYVEGPFGNGADWTTREVLNGVYVKANWCNIGYIRSYLFAGTGIVMCDWWDSVAARLAVEKCGAYGSFTGSIAPYTATATAWSITATNGLLPAQITFSGTISGTLYPGMVITGLTGASNTTNTLAQNISGNTWALVASEGASASGSSATGTCGKLTVSSLTGNNAPIGIGQEIWCSTAINLQTTVVAGSGTVWYLSGGGQTVASTTLTNHSFSIAVTTNWFGYTGNTNGNTSTPAGGNNTSNCFHISSLQCEQAVQHGLLLGVAGGIGASGGIVRAVFSNIHSERLSIQSTSDGWSYGGGASYCNDYIAGQNVTINGAMTDSFTGTTVWGQNGYAAIAGYYRDIFLNLSQPSHIHGWDAVGANVGGAGCNINTYNGTGYSIEDLTCANWYQAYGSAAQFTLTNCNIIATCQPNNFVDFFGCTIATLNCAYNTSQLRFYGGTITTVNMNQAIQGDISWSGVQITTITKVGTYASPHQLPAFNDCNIGSFNAASGDTCVINGGTIGTFNPASVTYLTNNVTVTGTFSTAWTVPTTASAYPIGTRTQRPAGPNSSWTNTTGTYVCSNAATPSWTGGP